MSNSTWENILFWLSIGDKYTSIKNNSEKRDTSVSMGTTSLILSIVGAIATYGLTFVAYFCFTDGGIGKIIGGIFAALVAVTCFIYMLIASVVHAAFQVKLNKKPIGKVALAFSLILTIAPVAIGIVVFLLIAM